MGHILFFLFDFSYPYPISARRTSPGEKALHGRNQHRAASRLVPVKGNGNTHNAAIRIPLRYGEGSSTFGAFRHIPDAGDRLSHDDNIVSNLNDLAPVRRGVAKADNAASLFFERHTP
jgi:hypothetical protein